MEYEEWMNEENKKKEANYFTNKYLSCYKPNVYTYMNISFLNKKRKCHDQANLYLFNHHHHQKNNRHIRQ